MSTDITSLSGYNQQDYKDLLTEYTQRTGKTEEQFKTYLNSLVTSEMTFDELEAKVKDELPPLTPPVYEQGYCLYVGTAPASFGSTYLALIQDLAAEQRKQNADAKALQTEAQIDNIEQQAKNIRTKAALDLTASVISGTFQFASGITGAVMSGAALKAGGGADVGMVQASQIQGVTGAISGAGTVVSGTFTFGGTMIEAQTKELEADAERMRATQEQLSRIDDALRELLQKARSTQDAIQQNMNQTRARILG